MDFRLKYEIVDAEDAVKFTSCKALISQTDLTDTIITKLKIKILYVSQNVHTQL